MVPPKREATTAVEDEIPTSSDITEVDSTKIQSLKEISISGIVSKTGSKMNTLTK